MMNAVVNRPSFASCQSEPIAKIGIHVNSALRAA